jgi:hypothetical protein
MNKDLYLNLASKLVGEVPILVEYFEIEYEGHESPFSESTEYDALDYGINLRMSSGNVFGFFWGSEFTQYGVSILESDLWSEVTECRKIDVSMSKNWSHLVNREIENVEVIWQWVRYGGIFKKKIYYPQSVVLQFSGNVCVIISAMEITDTSHWGMADNIVVFFNENVAGRYGALNA